MMNGGRAPLALVSIGLCLTGTMESDKVPTRLWPNHFFLLGRPFRARPRRLLQWDRLGGRRAGHRGLGLGHSWEALLSSDDLPVRLKGFPSSPSGATHAAPSPAASHHTAVHPALPAGAND